MHMLGGFIKNDEIGLGKIEANEISSPNFTLSMQAQIYLIKKLCDCEQLVVHSGISKWPLILCLFTFLNSFRNITINSLHIVQPVASKSKTSASWDPN